VIKQVSVSPRGRQIVYKKESFRDPQFINTEQVSNQNESDCEPDSPIRRRKTYTKSKFKEELFPPGADYGTINAKAKHFKNTSDEQSSSIHTGSDSSGDED